jgi:hypothetical protein
MWVDNIKMDVLYRLLMIYGKWEGKTKVLEKNLLHCHFVHHKSRTEYHAIELGHAI